VHDGFQDLFNPNSGLRRARDSVGGIDRHRALDLLLGSLYIGMGQINLVDDGNDLKVLLHRHARVGNRLGFDTLAGVYHQDGALTGGQCSGHFVREVDMAGRIDEVQLVSLAICSGVQEADRRHFNGDSPLTFDVHRIEHLFLRSAADSTAPLDQPIGKRAFAVIDVCNDAEVTDVGLIHRGERTVYRLKSSPLGC